jgi:hypothetical protein
MQEAKMAEPTGAEILMWSLINRARLDPGGEAARYGIDLNEGPPRESQNGPVVTLTTTSKQPLAWNSALFSVADQHSQDMMNSQTLFHNPQATHETNLRNAGYNFSCWGENVSESSTLGTNPTQSVLEQAIYQQARSLFVDTSSSYRGHRVNILNDNFQEVGVGEVVGNFQGGTRSVITEDFGRPSTASQFLTGVTYNDNDGNKFYSIGEGRGGISISTSAGAVATGTAGAYSKALAAGTQTVTFSGGDLAAAVSFNVTMTVGRNAMVDLIGQSTVETSASLVAGSNVTKIIGLGNIGLSLTGNSLDNAIVSALGNDSIDGGAGTDTVVYSGNRASYTITQNANGTVTVTGLEGTDTLTSVERAQFADQTVVLSGTPTTGSISINDVSITEGNNGTQVAVFTVTRAGGTAAFDVNFATSNGTATTADGDYAANSGTLHFGANVNTQTISVTINGDTKVEANETFNVALSNATNGATISDGQGVGTIVNDDTAPTSTNHFSAATFEQATFGSGAGGWSSDNTYHREVADVNGDGRDDIIGFGSSGVWVALANGDGHFGTPSLNVSAFGANAGGWSSEDTYPREMADVNGDGMADIVGFGSAGVYVSLATGNGNFGAGNFALGAFGAGGGAGGWSSNDTYTRHLGDVNGDGMDDIIGFGSAGTYVSLATGGGHFAAPSLALAAFGTNTGGWNSDNTYPREIADVNGDGMADIVGFGSAGVYVALATGGGQFATPFLALNAFGAAGGWNNDDHYPRYVEDINHDGRADIVGFGESRVYVSLGQADGHFGAPTGDLAGFAPSAGGWVSNDTYHRVLGDVNGDGSADIVGFGSSGVFVSRAVEVLG